ncbi:metal cation symporter ZIP14-like [Hydractinia symbiolongicarpus]|uniref:metal cation symporter ZIP14-like n=1 Tax=Hydractinia symbiolongicarpus TaxID=13093 RepID=UPI00254D934E|nr:metal cation symporter ZIP14-like [Hydractinia symbiolongicarpus]
MVEGRCVFILFFFVVQVYTNEPSPLHGQNIESRCRNRLIRKIVEHLSDGVNENRDILTIKNVGRLFNELGFKNCLKNEKSQTCNLCTTAISFLEGKGINTTKTFTVEEFKPLLNGIIYILTKHSRRESLGVVCKTFLESQLSIINTDEYGLLKKQYGGVLNEKSLNKILNDINETIGRTLDHKNKCFSVDDVIRGANVSADKISANDFEYVRSYIILQLLDKKCIRLEQDLHKYNEHDGHDHDEFEFDLDEFDRTDHENEHEHDKHDHDKHEHDKHKHDKHEHDKHEHDTHKDDTAKTVKKSFFIEQVFSHYGNKSHMSSENFEHLVKKLKLGKEVSAEDEHAGHNHRKRKSIKSFRQIRSLSEQKCYSAKTMLSVFSVREGSFINDVKFQEMCPALIQQLETESCKETKEELSKEDKDSGSDWKPWVGAMFSTFIISLGSLSGVFAAPFSKKPYFSYVLMVLICLAVSTLIGDAILHLLPHSLDLHKHGEGGHDHSSGENEFLKPNSFLWKCVLVLFGIYIFFIFEILMHAFSGKHGHSHSLDNIDVLDESHKHLAPTDNINAENVKGTLQLNEEHLNTYIGGSNNGIIQRPSGIHECKEIVHKVVDDKSSKYSVSSEDDSEKQFLNDKDKSAMSVKTFKSVVWMVLIGDAIHNFMDGIAIGVAFTETWPSGLHGGISTSIAIFCHELPHELGDFAILISSGMTIKQALFMNFISSLTSFIGAILGVSLGTQWHAVPWLFAVTSGLFIYIALVDMLPEMLHNSLLKARPCLCFFLQNCGLLTGFMLMFFLAAWEEDIKAFIS